jgi:hypothetical protein
VPPTFPTTVGAPTSGAPPSWPAVPGEAATGAPPAYPGYEPDLKPPRRRRTLWLAIVAIVVVVAVVAAVFALRAHPAAAAVNVVGMPVAYEQALSPATTASNEITADKIANGPWSLYGAEGLGLPSSASGAEGLIANCTTVWENQSVVTLPSTPSNASAGEVATWVFFFGNATGAFLLTYVTDVAGALQSSNGVVVKGSCTSDFSVGGVVSSSTVNSVAIVPKANADGGTSFLTNHSRVTTLLLLLGPIWEVDYTTCSFGASSGTGAIFVAAFYASNETLIEKGSTTGAC